LTLSHTRGHLYRAVLEGTAFGVRHNLEAMRGMGAEPRRLVAVGGGAKNPVWLQIVSDASGLAQDVPERTIGASYGDAFLAGLATGIVPDRTSLRRDWVRIATRLEPDRSRHAAYEPYYAVYRRLYENAKQDLHELARLGQADGPA
jgi:xylulokinase